MNRTDGMGRLNELRQKINAEHRGRIEFVVTLRRSVAGLRKRLMDENRAVHAAWFGPTRAEQAKVARVKEAAAAHAKEVAEVARVKEAAAAARAKEAAEAARIKQAAAAAARVKEEAAEAARVKEAAAAIAAEAAARIKKAGKNMLVKATAKTAHVKAAKKVRGR